MINIKKSGLIVLLMALVIGSFAWNPPKMQCIKLLNNNQRVKVSWSCNDCAHFKAYYFYVNGVLADSLFGYSSSTQNYTLCDYGSKEINIPAPANYFDCYMTAVDSNDNQYFSDTFKALVDADYEGPVCLEVIGPELTMQAAQAIASESFGYMTAILKMLGNR